MLRREARINKSQLVTIQTLSNNQNKKLRDRIKNFAKKFCKINGTKNRFSTERDIAT